jgi:hypothetical protein
MSRAGKIKQNHNVTPVELFRSTIEKSNKDLIVATQLKSKISLNNSYNSFESLDYLNYFNSKKSNFLNVFEAADNYLLNDEKINSFSFFFNNFKNDYDSNLKIFSNIINKSYNFNNSNKISYYSDFIESSRYIKKQQGVLLPIRLIKLNQK